jgi:hypothetical protein
MVPAKNLIISRSAEDPIIAVLTEQNIVPISPFDSVAVCPSINGVVAIFANQEIIARLASEYVIAIATKNDIVPEATNEFIVAIVTEQEIVAIATIQYVRTQRTEQTIVIAASRKSIVSVLPVSNRFEGSAIGKDIIPVAPPIADLVHTGRGNRKSWYPSQ